MTERTHLTTAKEPGEASSQKTPKKQGEGRKTYLLSPRAYEIAVEFKTLAGRYTVSEFISACICAYGPSLISRYRDSPDSALADREDASLKELQTMMRKHAHASWRKRESAAKQAAYAALVEKLRAAKTLRQHQQFIEEAASLPELKAQALRDRAKQNKKLKKTSREEWAVLLKHRNEFLSL